MSFFKVSVGLSGILTFEESTCCSAAVRILSATSASISAYKQHGFIDSQRYGMDVFDEIPQEAPVIVAEAVWQYSHHILAGLYHHHSAILTVANWSGEWPSLVGMLGLNACPTKAGIRYDTLWSEQFLLKTATEPFTSTCLPAVCSR